MYVWQIGHQVSIATSLSKQLEQNRSWPHGISKDTIPSIFGISAIPDGGWRRHTSQQCACLHFMSWNLASWSVTFRSCIFRSCIFSALSYAMPICHMTNYDKLRWLVEMHVTWRSSMTIRCINHAQMKNSENRKTKKIVQRIKMVKISIFFIKDKKSFRTYRITNLYVISGMPRISFEGTNLTKF